jgi:hypothetical protein
LSQLGGFSSKEEQMKRAVIMSEEIPKQLTKGTSSGMEHEEVMFRWHIVALSAGSSHTMIN